MTKCSEVSRISHILASIISYHGSERCTGSSRFAESRNVVLGWVTWVKSCEGKLGQTAQIAAAALQIAGKLISRNSTDKIVDQQLILQLKSIFIHNF